MKFGREVCKLDFLVVCPVMTLGSWRSWEHEVTEGAWQKSVYGEGKMHSLGI